MAGLCSFICGVRARYARRTLPPPGPRQKFRCGQCCAGSSGSSAADPDRSPPSGSRRRSRTESLPAANTRRRRCRRPRTTAVDRGHHRKYRPGSRSAARPGSGADAGPGYTAAGEYSPPASAPSPRPRGAQTEQDEDQKGEKKPLAEIIDLPCITEGFKHLTSPQPSRQLSRFFLWRRPCKRQP